MSETIKNILAEENVAPNARVRSVCEAIAARHPGRVQAFMYYGSSLRDLETAEKMLDFYVVVDSYRKTHQNPLRAMLNRLIPPAVYYYEQTDENGVLSTCKYSIISIAEFEKRCGAHALLSMVWGRFCQPSVMLFPKKEMVAERLMASRETAVRHMAAQIAPLIDRPITSTEFWAKGFYESYRTELRPESSEGRAAEIVDRYGERYARLTTALYGLPDKDGLYILPDLPAGPTKTKWFVRRLLGKPMTAIRVINSAATFEGGLDYVLRKLKNHSGVTIEPTPFQRKHPVICSPVLGWKLWRKGAFN
ncbi:hypothetical protein [Hellea balneolensis]|uniref:hypothetical protein n=1 Tax=Hellea balneolensis TaxID=287478 RepID=UPI000408FE70|nr:hypothetical protein [Hellea balneolensis]